MDEWKITYRRYSDSELQAELAWLRQESRNLYNAQNIGDSGYQRSLSDIANRLAAATSIADERENVRPTSLPAVADFSGGGFS